MRWGDERGLGTDEKIKERGHEIRRNEVNVACVHYLAWCVTKMYLKPFCFLCKVVGI